MSLAFRAYFALPVELATTDGTVTNAVHGFTSMLVYLVREHSPGSLGVAFDLWGGTFRDELVDDYKGGRDETPDDLLPQFDMIRSVLHSLGIPVVTAEGFEADDVIATLATQARDDGLDVVVVTGDRDCYQLVEDPHVRVLYNRRGVSDYALYDEAGIVERTGVQPRLYPELAALRGDPSDNLPGVPGVGEKTAAKLLNTYGSLDAIFDHLDELTPKLRENLANNEGLARANARVIPLVRDVPLSVTVADLALGNWNAAAAKETFETFELKGTWGRMAALMEAGSLGPAASDSPPLEVDGASTTGGAARKGTVIASVSGEEAELAGGAEPLRIAPLEVELVRPLAEPDALKALAALDLGAANVAVAGRWSGLPGRSDLLGVALLANGSSEGVWIDATLLGAPAIAEALTTVLVNAPIAGHHIKELFRSLLPLGIDGTGLLMDTAVAAYLLDPSQGEYGLDGLVEPVEESAKPPVSAQLSFGDTGGTDDALVAAGEVARVTQLVGPLQARLEAEGLAALHDEVERPLVRVLARMEVLGIRVDRAELQRIADELVGDTERLEREIHQLAGHEFNVNSTPQLRTVLYDELGLTPGRKTKTGYSTDAQTLETLRDVHPIVDTLLRYREQEKLRSTYGESLLAEVAPDGRIHASFRQTVARTGRLSSDRPNLHNIPVRTEGGRRFRRAFIPADGSQFLVADYDQIELRVIAHLSGDPGLLEAFTSGSDIHRTVAAGVYGIEPSEVTKAQREFAKMVSYGLAYGMEAFGLARRLGTGVDEANEIMGRYFAAFSAVRDYMDNTVAEARSRGFTRTELGRKRPLPELREANFRMRQAAERQAMNAGIQGLAADLFKTALVRLDGALEARSLASRLVLQVHDEVIVEVAAGEEDVVAEMTEEALTQAADLAVPLKVSMAWGESWAAAKGG
jgi:DNA polymerase-1